MHDDDDQADLRERTAAALRGLSMAFRAAADKGPGLVYAGGRAEELATLAERAASVGLSPSREADAQEPAVEGAELALAGLRIACAGAGDLEAGAAAGLASDARALAELVPAWLRPLADHPELAPVARVLAEEAGRRAEQLAGG